MCVQGEGLSFRLYVENVMDPWLRAQRGDIGSGPKCCVSEGEEGTLGRGDMLAKVCSWDEETGESGQVWAENRCFMRTLCFRKSFLVVSL